MHASGRINSLLIPLANVLLVQKPSQEGVYGVLKLDTDGYLLLDTGGYLKLKLT